MLHYLSGGAWDPHDVNVVTLTSESTVQLWDLHVMKRDIGSGRMIGFPVVDVFSRHNILPPDVVVSARAVNSACAAAGGQLYMWGKLKNTSGDWMYPKPLMDLSGWNLRYMDFGHMFHFVGADTSCISWGHAQNGELGYGPNAQKFWSSLPWYSAIGIDAASEVEFPNLFGRSKDLISKSSSSSWLKKSLLTWTVSRKLFLGQLRMGNYFSGIILGKNSPLDIKLIRGCQAKWEEQL